MNKTIIALGTFDGVHLGHTALIDAACAAAKKLNIASAVFTFADHPAEQLTGKKVGWLVTAEQKIELLKAAGADKVFVKPFGEICNFSPSEFVDRLLLMAGAVGLVCGEDFRFGKDGAGDTAYLQQLCNERGLSLQVVGFVRDETGEKIASRRIREYIAAGDMQNAAKALGRTFFIEGQVRHGKGLAHRWGTPTINMELPEQLVTPKFGVYRTRVTVEGKTYDGITNVGSRPTFDDGTTPNVETYILDGKFDSIERAKVEFLKFIRPEQQFADESALVAQIQKDIESIRKEV